MYTKFTFKEDLHLRFSLLMNITVSNYFMCINMWSSVLINISKYLGARKNYSKMNCVSWSWIPFSWVRQAYKVELWTIISLVFLICTKQLHGKALRRIYTLHRSVFFCSWILNLFCEFWSFNFFVKSLTFFISSPDVSLYLIYTPKSWMRTYLISSCHFPVILSCCWIF